MIKFIDLFSGIGGFHQAMNSFDSECVFASEIDERAAAVYESNFGLRPHGDITKIEASDIPSHDLLCAGFPCQPFSISGQRKGFEDTRGTLFFDIMRIADHHRPKVLLLENVPNLGSVDDGSILRVIIDTIKDLGYAPQIKVLNASDFGLPQQRKRLFIVAFRGEYDFEFPRPKDEVTCLLDLLEDNPSDAHVVERDDIIFTREYTPHKDLFGMTDLPNRLLKLGHIEGGYKGRGYQGGRIYSPYGHAATLKTTGGKTEFYQIGDTIRRLSPP